MANNLTKVLAVVLIGIALLLGIYAWVLGRRPAPVVNQAQQAAPAKLFPVVVAAHPLKAGQPIPADGLKVQQAAGLPEGAFADPVQIIGRVPIADIPEQAAVVESSLSSGVADQIQAGERAVAVKVDETNAVGNRVRPGNFVDVFVNLKRDQSTGGLPGNGSSGPEITKTQAKLLLSKIRVLAFGDATTARDPSNGVGGAVRTAVLAVPTEQIDALTLAEAAGALTLALRSPRDEEVATDTAAMRVSANLAGKDPSARAALGLSLSELSRGVADTAPPPPRKPARVVARNPEGGSIEVIRGGRVDSASY
ncbi:MULTISPECIES: Flp pilus assembly protein CpaB [unclassified Burkholderia]|uniref:Flp pilus assembly protein CpaB n=1 Tax=unclassified Burkholderia TaxID=2613784 RepID=UPI000468B2A2|nr:MULTISPECIES: Flp pilus assembly protein CpaB [unclassified Burkholderia]NIE86312.1 Flp pilus assembly protein CpaB [Burkholderia sp. Tr-860]NIF66526.1 Flp pilus assembly protein CpaB [Burkholderia sp. Cy-647]NIF99055.1 Flp pilus assembly protein CpaB [Burkholderia sp. Ax-1720]